MCLFYFIFLILNRKIQMFDGMFELDSKYIVIVLILLSIICIYLLYNTITNSFSSSNVDRLHLYVEELVTHRKKQDEVIHYLVEQVRLLKSTPPTSLSSNNNPLDNGMVSQSDVITNTEVNDVNNDGESNIDVEDMNNLQNELNNCELSETDKDSALSNIDTDKLDNLLRDNEYELDNNMVDGDNNTNDDSDNEDNNNEDNDIVVNKLKNMNDTNDNNDNNNNSDDGVFDELKNMNDSNSNDTDNNNKTMESIDNLGLKNVDLDVSNASVLDNALNNEKVELKKDKNYLRLYKVSQLKEFAKDMGLTARGSKDVLINIIYESL